MAIAIDVSHVTIEFKMPREKVDSLKEYLIRFVKGKNQSDSFIALNDVSFTVDKGDVIGIIGLNGSGKSTLLKVISGIMKPMKGYCKSYGSISPLIELGSGFDMDLTARENIFLNGSVLGFSRKQMKDKFNDIVEFSELHQFIDVALKNYSSGMIARLGFSIATIVKPDILILDEILSVGDFLFQQKCEERIQNLMSGGTTVLIVSHSVEQIERLCSKAIWLEKGYIRKMGDTLTVCHDYKSARGERIHG